MPREKHIPAPPAKGGKKAFFLSPKTEELIRKLAGRTDVELDVNQFEMIERNGVRHYRLRPAPEKPDRSGASTLPPLWVTKYNLPAGAYEISVGWGYLYEIIPGADDAILPHEPANLWDETDPEELARFTITTGQAVYVKAHVTAQGTIGAPEPGEGEDPEDAVSIVIAADDVSSIHYTPRVDNLNTDGAPGIIYYKLAVLEAGVGEGAPPKLKRYLTGSHILHVEDLPAILSTLAPAEGVGVIPLEWSDSERAYKLRAIFKGFGKNNITTNADHVEVRGTKKDADVRVWYGDTVDSEPLIEIKDGYSLTGADVIGNEEEPVPPSELNVFIPEVVAGSGCTVTNIAAGDGEGFPTGRKIYQVSASGGGHPWQVTANGDATVSVAAGCVLSYVELSLTLKKFKTYDGTTTPTVTGAGFIYGEITPAYGSFPDINFSGTDSGSDTFDVNLLRVFPDSSASLAVSFGASVPTSGGFFFEIAEVSLDGSGNAVVDYQTLTHNPTLASWIEPP